MIGINNGVRLVLSIESGKITSARVLKIEEDSSSEHTEYKIKLELEGEEDLHPKIVHMVRHRNDFVVGQNIRLLLGENKDQILFEEDLGGGMSFSNIVESGFAPMVPLMRVLTIPFLSFLPLIGLAPMVSVFFRDLAAQIDPSIAYGWAVLAQVLWLLINRRVFRFGRISRQPIA